MMLNRVLLSGMIQIVDNRAYSAQEGLCTDLALFPRDWWHDRADKPHMLNVPVRVPNRLLELESPLQSGMTLLVEGRLTRWSPGREYDNRSAVTGIEAERILILEDPPEEPPRSTASRSPMAAQVEESRAPESGA